MRVFKGETRQGVCSVRLEVGEDTTLAQLATLLRNRLVEEEEISEKAIHFEGDGRRVKDMTALVSSFSDLSFTVLDSDVNRQENFQQHLDRELDRWEQTPSSYSRAQFADEDQLD